MFLIPDMQLEIYDARTRVIRWIIFHKKGIINEKHYKCLTSTIEEENMYLSSRFNEWFESMLRVLYTIRRAVVLQTILVKIDDALSAWSPELPDRYTRTGRIELSSFRVSLFHRYAKLWNINIWQAFMELLKHEDIFTQRMAMIIISKLASFSEQQMPTEELNMYLKHLDDQLSANEKDFTKVDPCEGLQCISSCMQRMLTVTDYRVAFANLDCIGTVVSILGTQITPQVQYQLIYCLWLVSFNGELSVKISKYNTVAIIADIFNNCDREKLFRIILALFRNLLEETLDPAVVKQYCRNIIRSELQRQLLILEQNRYSDEDIVENIDFLVQRLTDSEKDLSSFEEYRLEVGSGRLEWTPVHKSKKFWAKNAHRLNRRGHELLKILISCLERHNETVVLMVACHDIGEYIAHYPKGKKFLEHMKVRSMIVNLLSHPDQNVCHEALLCLQKLLLVQSRH